MEPAETKENQSTNWLTLSEAQALLGVSRKTLYRYMDKKQLQYKKSTNGRRYIELQTLQNFIEQYLIRTAQTKSTAQTQSKQTPIQKCPQQQNLQTAPPDYPAFATKIEQLTQQIEKQNNLLVTLIKLYQPQNMHDILVKKGIT